MKINFARNDYDEQEINAVNRVLQSNWLASGPENEALEKEFAEYVGATHSICVNSGSSANLLALASLGLTPGSKVLTSACGFPATLAPIIHLGLTPILVDYDLETHNIDVSQVIKHLHEVDAVILAHTLGNPVDIEAITYYAQILGVPVIEDCCEAAGTFLNGQSVGTFGDIGTFSFYPSHQLTAGGGGGMIVTNNQSLMLRCKSMRDWGKVWNWDEKLGDNQTFYSEDVGLDYKYYRHYCYDTIGFNFKLPEMNAAFGREQLKKLDRFASIRQHHFNYLKSKLSHLDDFIQIKTWPESERVSWFGYVFTIKDGSPINRNQFGDYLESKGIRHRPFFAGNICRQRAFEGLISGTFPVADKLMRDSLFIGCHTKISQEDLDYIVETVTNYVETIHANPVRS